MASIYNNYMVDKNGNLVDRRNVYGEEGSEIETDENDQFRDFLSQVI